MLKQLKKYISAKDKLNNIPCTYEQINHNPKFKLSYQENIVGFLNYEDNMWSFEYSDWFKGQNDLQTLFEFPIKDRVYKSNKLWPFFESRIPSLKQPKIQEYLEGNPLDTNNKVKLLSVFGITSVNNPYKLQSM